MWRITPHLGDYWEAWALWHYESLIGRWKIHSIYTKRQGAQQAMEEMVKAA